MSLAPIVLAFVLLALLSLAALWSWGKFAHAARGTPSSALPIADSATGLDRLVQPLLDAHADGESAAVLIDDAVDAFLARAHSSRMAERSLDLQYYIWNHDLSGHLLDGELLQAAERGVRVRLLLDDMNAAGKDPALLLLAEQPNIEVRLFNPARNRDAGLRRALEMGLRFVGFNRRMHNKAWIADNRLAIVGGRNVGDEYFGAARTNFRDTDLLLLGPAVAQASSIFDAFWNSDAVVPLRRLAPRKALVTLAQQETRQAEWQAQAAGSPWLAALHGHEQWLTRTLQGANLTLHWSAHYQVLSDPPEKASPLRRCRDRAQWLLYDVMALLFSARVQSCIMSPYFIPGEAGALMLSGQARRAVEVRVLTNSLAASDVPMVHAGYRKYREDLLRHGVQLYELKPAAHRTSRALVGASGASLHSKFIMVDGARGFVGSFNFDPRSVQLNTEMGVLFDQPALAQALARFFNESTAPELAWQVTQSDAGRLQWLDQTGTRHATEPQTRAGLRVLVWLLGLLPLESQL